MYIYILFYILYNGGGGEGRGRNHLDIATNSTDEISKNVQLRKSALRRPM